MRAYIVEVVPTEMTDGGQPIDALCRYLRGGYI